MTLEECKAWLGHAYVLHPAYDRTKHPNHSSYHLVDVRATCERIRQKRQESFSDAVEQTRKKFRLIYGQAKVAA